MKNIKAVILVVCLCLSGLANAQKAPQIGKVERGCKALPRLSASGRYFVDKEGNTHILRGVNFVVKTPPDTPQSYGLNDDVAAFLRDSGVTVVRLGLLWKGVEPAPGVYDDTYIGQVRDAALLLACYGIYTVLDSHQDMFGEMFGLHGGDGFPAWAANTTYNGTSWPDGFPQPDGSVYGPLDFPDNYMISFGLNVAFRNFWLNVPASDGEGIRDHFVKSWQYAATAFKDDSNILGYNTMNEPFDPALADVVTTLEFGFPLFNTFLGPTIGTESEWQEGMFTEFLNELVAGIRRVDRKTPIFYQYDISTSLALPLPPLSNLTNRPNLVQLFSQYYPLPVFGFPDTRSLLEGQLAQAIEFADSRGNPYFIGEWSAPPPLGDKDYNPTNPSITQSADMYDATLTSWAYWELGGYPGTDYRALLNDIHDSVTISPSNTNLTASYIELSRPYAEVVAGTPLSMTYDVDSKAFNLTYTKISSIDQRCIQGNTVIYVPALKYPAGYSVWVEGAKIVDKETQILVLRNNGCDHRNVHVEVTAK